MTNDDDISIRLAADRRRYEDFVKAEEDAKRAELPVAIQDRERWVFWKRLVRRVLKRVVL